ncbi:Fungal trichothecene efflux pump (TRI12) [Geosmithia morbida]|uniref:Fungal trichothecene efflux pump (TRI12) n=1 Tax=Geosmithia morbida TaxID=1094350 RepID=A0A9P4YXH5_9HYPO|nr:Fungal trichothecene efflux pump (TRI12) [Geosmithia morbida]KAF4123607.1 Fungal trichothecene efflux pump (TRI12) [Geosmithia morbida]
MAVLDYDSGEPGTQLHYLIPGLAGRPARDPRLPLYKNDQPLIFGMLIIVCFGLGLGLMPGTVIGLLALAVPLGGTIGLVIMSTVFNNIPDLNANINLA